MDCKFCGQPMERHREEPIALQPTRSFFFRVQCNMQPGTTEPHRGNDEETLQDQAEDRDESHDRTADDDRR